MASPDLAAHFYDHVVRLLNKEPKDRGDQEIDQILTWFRKKSDLFKSLKREIIADIIKNCEFETTDKDDVIIEQGDKGDCFFIILSGTVAIHINTNFGTDDDNNNVDKVKDRAVSREDCVSVASDKKPLDRSRYGNFVGKIEAGKSFGELALINADCVRNATIIANERTDLVVVNRELYNRSLKAFQEKEFEERKKFVETQELFANWQHKYKKQMAMSLRKEKMYFDSVIVRQGTPVDGLIFLLSGQVKIITDPLLHELQYPCFFPLANPEDLEKEEARESLRRELSMVTPKSDHKRSSDKRYPTPHSNMSSPHSSVISPHVMSPSQDGRTKTRTPHRSVVEVCNLGAQEIIGDLEAVLDLPTYSYTIICSQEAEFYILDQKNYDRLIEKRNPKVIDMLRKSVCHKYSIRLSWVQDNQIPLLRYFLYKLEEELKTRSQRSTITKSQVKDNSSDWDITNLTKGPLVDMFGPGSVFYTIRMKEKQRHREKDRYKMEKMRMHTRSHTTITPRATVQTSTPPPLQTQKTFVTQTGIMADIIDEDENFEDSGDVEEGDETDAGGNKLVCDNSKSTMENGLSNDDLVDDSVDDKEVNDSALQKLESKIEAWHKSLGEDPYRRHVKRTVRLHRMKQEVTSSPPHPGKTVYIRPKQRKKIDVIATIKSSVKEEEDPVPSMFRYTIVRNTNASSMPPQNSDSSLEKVNNHKGGHLRPLSARSMLVPSYVTKKKRPISARQYTAQDYEALKEELRRKQKAFKSLLSRPSNSFL